MLRTALAVPFVLIALFLASAWIGSAIPVNNDWREPDQGVEIAVETNGIHVSLIVPMAAEGQDLSDLVRPQDMEDPSLYGTHAMIGWGHAGVYRNARTWAEVRSGDVASAIIGSDDVIIHVYHLINPQPSPDARHIRVTREQYLSIIRQIRSTFRLTKDGSSISYPAYGPDNVFYAAKGHYSAFHTCNDWTGSILRGAGVRVGWWTPFAGGVMRWF